MHQCLIAGVDLVCEMLHGLALLDPRKCANVAWASLTIPFLLPRAWRHRKIGSVGALWAEPLRAEAVEARTLQPGEP